MRTTVNIADDLMKAIRSLAHERGESLGAIVWRPSTVVSSI